MQTLQVATLIYSETIKNTVGFFSRSFEIIGVQENISVFLPVLFQCHLDTIIVFVNILN